MDPAESSEVDAAIMRVLAAEQAVREEVERCRREAEHAVESAHRNARVIAERAARRVARIHRWTDNAIAARIEELEAQRAALLTAPRDSEDDALLSRAVEHLADELAGPSG